MLLLVSIGGLTPTSSPWLTVSSRGRRPKYEVEAWFICVGVRARDTSKGNMIPASQPQIPLVA